MAASEPQGTAMNAPVTQDNPSAPPSAETSYKFQRLREKLRRAIESGELSGKLPGERALARRFHVNAKTLSKALTDLAAEGLLDRSIGRGTYVKGSTPAPVKCIGKWLVICDGRAESSCLVASLRDSCPDLETITTVEQVRPSFINQFSAVINLSPGTPETFLRQLLVRNMPLVGVNHEPKAYSMHSIMPDLVLGITRIGRDLLLGGHRRIGAIEPHGRTEVLHALRQAAGRYAPDAIVESADVTEAAHLIAEGATALVCGSVDEACRLRRDLAARNIAVPEQVSLAAVGCSCPDSGCSGYFVECRKLADGVVGLLREVPTRPVSLWLPGSWIDRGTVGSADGALPMNAPTPLHVSGVVV